MESCSTPTTAASFSTRLPINATFGKSSLLPAGVKFSSSRIALSSKLRVTNTKAKVSEKAIGKLGQNDIVSETEKDDNLAFVAGSTGRVGSRTVRELLKLGFRVRAGVRTAQKAEALVERETPATDRLEIIECDLEKTNEIVPALGNASVVLCCIGASEKEISDIKGPYRIDYLATKNLVNAASAVQVKHFIMVSSLGTNKIGFPAALLNLFWGVLIWKRKAEEALISSGIPYTIVRPGGMERPTDAFKETHNLTLSEEDTLFGGLVSTLQIAELIAFMARNRKESCCKVVEAIATTSAPLTPMNKLLGRIRPQRECKEEAVAVKEMKAENVEIVGKSSPLSPFTMYDDMKPPSSPSPKT